MHFWHSLSFRGSHFDNPNILAHVRYDERPALDGKKTLFLEEVQSDWANKGKQEGYNDPNRRTALETQISDLGKRRQEIENKGTDATEQEKQEWADIKNTLVGLQRTFNATHKGVPDMPFKETWHELAAKRMLRHAAENGYDRLAWVTGDQTAERYDLSKHIDEIRVTKAADNGNFSITAFKDGSPVIKETDVDAPRVSDYVGKELSQKIVSQPAGKQHIYSGVDLKMGGEALKKFYDVVLPRFLNQYGKKWNAKVGTTDIVTGTDTDRLFVGNEPSQAGLKEAWRTSAGTLHTAVNNVISAMQEGKSFSKAMDSFGTEQLAEKLGGKMQYGKPRTEKVHSIPITPEMKKSVLQGQPISKAIPQNFDWRSAVQQLAA
jgi:hypothetical protein